jgi:hypothetical protein
MELPHNFCSAHEIMAEVDTSKSSVCLAGSNMGFSTEPNLWGEKVHVTPSLDQEIPPWSPEDQEAHTGEDETWRYILHTHVIYIYTVYKLPRWMEYLHWIMGWIMGYIEYH